MRLEPRPSRQRFAVAARLVVPELDVLLTDSAREPEHIMCPWSEALHAGLYIESLSSFRASMPPNRASLLQLAAGSRVFLLNSEVGRRSIPRRLPRPVERLLAHRNGTFNGTGIAGDVAQRVRLQDQGGGVGAHIPESDAQRWGANRVFGTNMSKGKKSTIST